jgi:threonine/homoserine/homoserine lactone efflux protein
VLIVYFLIGVSVCFASTLPFGPVNLTVARITVEKNPFRGFEVAVAAAAVETLQVLLAVWFGMLISAFLEDNFIFRATVATVFLLIGVIVFRRRPAQGLAMDDHYFGSEIKTGLLVAALNPQAIPFWIIALAAIDDYTDLTFQGLELALFLTGVLVGKVLALTGFILVSAYLKTHLDQSSRLVNHILGSVLIIIGVMQWIRLLLTV